MTAHPLGRPAQMSAPTKDPGLAARDRRKAAYEAPGTKVGD